MAVRGEWDPLKEMRQVQRRLNGLFESALARTEFDAGDGVDSWAPVADVYETSTELVLQLELPGLSQDQIDVRVDADELVVEGERHMDREVAAEQFHRVERSYGRFSRRFSLPSAFDRGAVQARYRHGLLQIRVPRSGEGRADPIRVSIG